MIQNAGQHRNDLIGLFAQHKVAANLLMIIMLMAGVVGLIKLNTQFFPTFALDFITVRVVWPGASAEDVARSITSPLEQELQDLDNVKEMRSTSARGFASIVLEYEEGSNMSIALDNVKDRVSLVRNLPAEAEDPQIRTFNRHEDVATLIVTSEGSLAELRAVARDLEDQLLERGIAKIEFTGLPEEELAIQLDTADIIDLQRPIPAIGRLIVNQSQDIPAGTTGRKEAARELRSLEQKRDAESFRQLALLTTTSGEQLRLGDIAEVERRSKDQTVEVLYDDKPAVLMKLLRTENADTLENAAILQTWLADIEGTLPPSIEVLPFSEAYVLIQERIDLLLKNGLGGLVLVVAILFIFLNGRVAFWVAVGIPVSFMGTLFVLYLIGGSINMVSLFALIMALGIIVDDAIVVGEDALTHYTKGESALKAAEGGARRMFVPVMSSSLTTIAAFLPLMLISGIIGSILKAIPIVIICVIIASLIESFLILPGHLESSFKKNRHRKPGKLRLKLDAGFNHFRDNMFRPLVAAALRHRALSLAMILCSFVLSISLLASGQIKFTFFPTPESTLITASVKFVASADEDEVRAFALEMDHALERVNKSLGGETDLVVHSVVRLGQGTFDGGRNFQSGEQYANVQAELISSDRRDVRNTELIAAWRDALPKTPGIEQISMTSPRGGPPGEDIDIFLSGAAPETLKRAANDLIDVLANFEGVSNIQDDLPYGRQQSIYSLTPTGAALGLSVAEVGAQLRSAFDGQLLQIYHDEEEEVEVRIMLSDAARDYHRTLATFPIITPTGAAVPLDDVVDIKPRRGLEVLRHTGGKLGIHVTADVDASVTNANTILTGLAENELQSIAADHGVRYELQGRAEEQRDTGGDMLLGAVLGISLMYLILAWVFSSYLWPLAVMIAIPFGLTGAVFGHWVQGLDLTILSLFGFFALSGIVVNDSIILVSFYQDLRREGIPVATALVEATCQRLRAVLLTSLTTIAGLLPLLFETSLQAQFLIPMASSISFGLAFATVLILFAIPIMLSLLEGAQARVGSLFKGKGHPDTP